MIHFATYMSRQVSSLGRSLRSELVMSAEKSLGFGLNGRALDSW